MELSSKNEQLVDALFDQEYASHLKGRLRMEVGENLPCCEKSNPKGMERIRFSVIKLISENRYDEDQSIELAKVDWRDLLMAAGYGNTEAHKKWALQTIT